MHVLRAVRNDARSLCQLGERQHGEHSKVPEPHGGLAHGAVSTANGVVYAGAMNGYMYALDAETGALLWEFLGEASSNAGPAIAGGSVYWGNGYSHNQGTASHTFYAFALPRHGHYY